MLQTSDLDFNYPQELVAQTALPRGESRILSISREKEKFEELTWQKFLGLFERGDVLVLNDSRVIWARLIIAKPSGAEGEIFFLKSFGDQWEILSKGLNLKEGKEISLPGGVKAKVIRAGRTSDIKLLKSVDIKTYFEKYGHVPLPPYITNLRDPKVDYEIQDRTRYQNIWAKALGSVAAPTAGLHFTEKILSALKEKGVNITYVTLHVGAGTFLPITTENLNDFEIHSEVMEVGEETCAAILKAQASGKKVWACGTTSLRALETAVIASPKNTGRLPLIAPFIGETQLFIQPGYRFLVVDGLLTNFHQPRSSLLALAATFATKLPTTTESESRKAIQKLLRAYQWAIEKKFRLFSYGDLTVIS
jgi:S-adenosylmethionine:tRNA ribosyltransferase-isomerase